MKINSQIIITMQPKIITLANNITLLTDYMPQIESVTIKLLFKVGSRNEINYSNGIAHCIEHMHFKGTNKRNAQEIAEEFDNIGGYLNAYTGRERTVYYAKVLKEDIATAIDILSDISCNSIYDEEELKKEKNVILQEIAEAKDNPDDAIFDLLQQGIYGNHNMGLPITGTKESVMTITKKEIEDFIRDYYHCDNLIIAISGNFIEEQIVELLSKSFDQSMRDSQVKEIKINKPQYNNCDLREKRNIEQAHFILSFSGASYKSCDYYLQQIASLIAGGGMSSRLFQEIREKRGLAYSISSFCSSYSDCGLWGLYGITGANQLNELAEVTISELLNLSEKVYEEELARAKAQVKSSILMAQESSSSRAERMIANYAVFQRFISLEEIIDQINLINVTMVEKKIKDIVLNSNPSLVALGNIDCLRSYDHIVEQLKK